MKHLFIIFSLLLTSVSWSKDIDWNDLVKRDGLWYEKFTNEPFTGNSTGLKQGKFKDGKKVGRIISGNRDGLAVGIRKDSIVQSLKLSLVYFLELG